MDTGGGGRPTSVAAFFDLDKPEYRGPARLHWFRQGRHLQGLDGGAAICAEPR